MPLVAEGSFFMISNYYHDKRRIKLLRECLLGEYIDAFADSFAKHDYSIGVVRAYLQYGKARLMPVNLTMNYQ